MTPAVYYAYPMCEVEPPHWLERWGGAIVTVAVHLALAMVLFSRPLERPVPRIPDPPSIVMMLAPADPLPETLPSSSFEPVAATAASAAEEQSAAMTDAVELPPEVSEIEQALAQASEVAGESGSGARLVLSPALAGQLREEARRIAKERQDLRKEQVDLEASLMRIEMESKGRNFTLSTDGARTGAVRVLNVSDYPPEIVRQVFSRYNIRIERNVIPSSAGVGMPSFLNAAETKDGTYRNVPAEGPQDVFVLTTRAVHLLSLMETQALQVRGYDIRRARIREVHFGIVKNEQNEWDLGVTHLLAEEVR